MATNSKAWDDHWIVRAERDTTDDRLIAEDEHGDLWAPSRRRRGWWDRRLNLRRPTHWPAYLRSRVTRRIGHIELQDTPNV